MADKSRSIFDMVEYSIIILHMYFISCKQLKIYIKTKNSICAHKIWVLIASQAEPTQMPGLAKTFTSRIHNAEFQTCTPSGYASTGI